MSGSSSSRVIARCRRSDRGRRYISWYVFHMTRRHLDPDEVRISLGAEVLDGFTTLLERTKADLELYRNDHPVFVSDATKRGLANWIHDRMRVHAIDVFNSTTGVVVLDKEPKFELYFFRDTVTYRVRLKKQDAIGGISNYPTDGALDFITQPEGDLFAELGLTEVNLCIGYEWDEFTHDMLSGLISLHDGSFRDAVWVCELPQAVGGVMVPIVPAGDGPTTPIITIVADETAEDEKEGEIE